VCRDCNCALLAGHAEGPFQHGAHEHEARDYLNDYDRADEEHEGFGQENFLGDPTPMMAAAPTSTNSTMDPAAIFPADFLDSVFMMSSSPH